MLQLSRLRESVNDYILFAVLFCICGVWAYAYRTHKRSARPRPTARDVTMTVEGRRLFVQGKILNAICDAILTVYLDGDITADEANAELATLAKFYHHEELIPLINDKKNRLFKQRLKATQRRIKLGNKAKPLPIPEPSKVLIKPKDDGERLASILGTL